MKSGWRHNECVQRIERVFSHAHRILFDACRRLPSRGRLIPQRRVRTSSAMGTAVARGSQPRKVRRKKKKERKRRRRISERKEKKREKKACKVGSRVGAPSWGAMLLTDFAYTSFSLLHGSVFDQSNGIFSTTRVLDGRDPGDIGHFLVAIRQWKPPTVKTIGKEKKERNTRGVKSVVSVSAGGLLSNI